MAVERRARVVDIIEHRPGLRSLRLALDGPLAFHPGQFVSLLLPVGPRPPLTRAYSIASTPEAGDPIELCLDHVPGGPGSTYLFSLGVGAEVRWTGPWGSFLLEHAPDVETVFIAESTGIAPIHPMLARAVVTTQHPLHLLYGRGHDLFREELGRLPRLRIVDTAPEDLEREARQRWIDADAIRDRRFFICGVGERVHRLRDLLRAAGYDRRAVQYERW